MHSLWIIVTVLLVVAIFMVITRLDLRLKLFFEFGIFPSAGTQRKIAVEIAQLFIQYGQSLERDKPNEPKIDKASVTTELFTQLYGISPIAFLGTTFPRLVQTRQID